MFKPPARFNPFHSLKLGNVICRPSVSWRSVRNYATNSNTRDNDIRSEQGINYKRYPKSLKVNPSKFLRRNVGEKLDADKNHDLKTLLSMFTVKTCTTVTTGERYDFKKVIPLLRNLGIQPITLIPDEIITFKYTAQGERADVMVLADNGSVICWGLNEILALSDIVPMLNDARINPLKESQYETEDIDFLEIEYEKGLTANMSEMLSNGSFILDDILIVNSMDSELGLLDKAAFSSGIARSTSLAVLEAALEEHIQKSRAITEKFSKGILINLKEKHFLTSIGKLFLIRGRLNLYSTLIETPDLYWSEPRLEKIYKNVSQFLDISPRIKILNSKLDYSTDHSRMLLSVINEKKGTFLEWIIIYLITVEVFFELHHYYERYSQPKETRQV